tara:strand:- start:1918 stop:2205 length:288 start_codon:yes stop_codon:yes gene_type:complete
MLQTLIDNTPEHPQVFSALMEELGVDPTDQQFEDKLSIYSWDNVRKQRNSLLAETDFYANTDVTMSADMTTYRQALRDIPASTADSEDVVWPTKP